MVAQAQAQSSNTAAAEEQAQSSVTAVAEEQGQSSVTVAAEEGEIDGSSESWPRPSPGEKPPLGADEVYLDQLTDAQRQTIEQARVRYLELGGTLDEHAEVFLLRFFVMHKWNTKRAHAMMKSTAAWRAKVGADAVRRRVAEDTPFLGLGESRASSEVMLQCVSLLPRYGEDWRRNQLSLLEAQSFDIPALFELMSDKEFFEWNLYWLEYLSFNADRLSSQRRLLVRQSMLIDAAKCPAALISLRMIWRFKPVLPLADAYYPEFLGGALILHANWFIHKVWVIIAPLLGEEIRKRVLIADVAGSPAALRRLASAEQLPSCVGGACKVLPAQVARWYAEGFAGLEGGGTLFPGETLGRHARAGCEAVGLALERGATS